MSKIASHLCWELMQLMKMTQNAVMQLLKAATRGFGVDSLQHTSPPSTLDWIQLRRIGRQKYQFELSLMLK